MFGLPLIRVTEAERTYNETRELIQDAVTAKFGSSAANGLCAGAWIRDMTNEWVVYDLDSGADPGSYKVTYSIDGAGAVTLGTPAKVEAVTVYNTVESTDRIPGRVLEAKGADDKGGRIFRVQIIEYGDSKNGTRYPEAVMRRAVPLYEGAKAYDHHRSEAELQTSTINGLVGSYTNVEAGTRAIEADLHLLPSASHTAEALDASLAAQARNLPPLVGISHDVAGQFRQVVEGPRKVMEAVALVAVNSADVVADPAAGGRATRMVAGGTGDSDRSTNNRSTNNGKGDMNLKELLALLRNADATKRTELLTEHAALLEGWGISADDAVRFATADDKATEPPKPADEPKVPAGVAAGAAGSPTAPALTPGGGQQAQESTFARDSMLGQLMISGAVKSAGLDDKLIPSVTKLLPVRFTEADLTGQVANVSTLRAEMERANLVPSVPSITTTKESRDKKIAALDAMFDGNYREGYASFKAAFVDITGFDTRRMFATDSGDFNRTVLRESAGGREYDSGTQRVTESLDSTTWDVILGDSITRRLLKEYSLPQLQSWRNIVSDINPVADFRTQRRERLGGYGVLPVVNQGAPYQPLTSPNDEEVTYSITKKGGTEDLTLEMIANDDLGAIRKIPMRLGRAAAQTLFRFVWDLVRTNPTLGFDSTALFASGHGNTDNPAALAQSTLSTGRRKMRQQTAYGDSYEVLGVVPKYLVVPSTLEELAFQLCTSAVALGVGAGTTAGANVTDIPNIHQGLEPIVVDYLTDTDDWYLVGDPALTPTIEVGFYQGRQDPELFVQNDPTTGAPFNADKIVWKIRHIYNGTVLDYRAFYRGQGS